MVRVAGQLAFASLLVACGGDGFVGTLREPPEPPDTTTGPDVTTETTAADLESSTSGVFGEACAADTPCPDGAFCAAPNAGGATVGVGAYACSSMCVDLDDPSRWCLDAASCCDAEASCEDGFCRVATADGSSSEVGSEVGSGGSTDASTGSSTDASTSG